MMKNSRKYDYDRIDAYASEVPATFRLFNLHVFERYFKVFVLKDDLTHTLYYPFAILHSH